MFSNFIRGLSSSIDNATGGVFRTDHGNIGSSISCTGVGGTPQVVDEDEVNEEEVQNGLSDSEAIDVICLGIAVRNKR